MDKEDREYLRNLIRERLRGWVEIPPDTVLNEIIADMWDEFKVIQDKERWMKKLE
jgi:hypothetical protein